MIDGIPGASLCVVNLTSTFVHEHPNLECLDFVFVVDENSIDYKPLVDELRRTGRLEDAGAAAIVLRSLFEEQIEHEERQIATGTEHGRRRGRVDPQAQVGAGDLEAVAALGEDAQPVERREPAQAARERLAQFVGTASDNLVFVENATGTGMFYETFLLIPQEKTR